MIMYRWINLLANLEFPNFEDLTMEKLLTPPEVAELLQCSTGTVRNMVRSGQLAHVKIGEGKRRVTVRIPRSALEKFEVSTPDPMRLKVYSRRGGIRDCPLFAPLRQVLEYARDIPGRSRTHTPWPAQTRDAGSHAKCCGGCRQQ